MAKFENQAARQRAFEDEAERVQENKIIDMLLAQKEKEVTAKKNSTYNMAELNAATVYRLQQENEEKTTRMKREEKEMNSSRRRDKVLRQKKNRKKT